jgi:hypothetical protein
MLKYNILVDFVVEAETEERAEEQLRKYLMMADLDHALTYGITNSELVEFLTEECDNS